MMKMFPPSVDFSRPRRKLKKSLGVEKVEEISEELGIKN